MGNSPARSKSLRAAARGFTLIELLMVVAIIGILAAIALPNLAEAMTRCEVARVHADLRTLATGLEAYRVDAGGYPLVGNPSLPSPSDVSTPLAKRLAPLTTPIAYLTTLPEDPFYHSAAEGVSGLGSTYVYCPGNLYHGGAAAYTGPAYRNSIYSVAGRGPDRKIFFGGYCMAHPAAYQNNAVIEGLYDPTNGTVSAGDLWRTGGSSLGR